MKLIPSLICDILSQPSKLYVLLKLIKFSLFNLNAPSPTDSQFTADPNRFPIVHYHPICRSQQLHSRIYSMTPIRPIQQLIIHQSFPLHLHQPPVTLGYRQKLCHTRTNNTKKKDWFYLSYNLSSFHCPFFTEFRVSLNGSTFATVFLCAVKSVAAQRYYKVGFLVLVYEWLFTVYLSFGLSKQRSEK